MFPCTSCGLCCQNISSIEELKDFDIGNGTCMHFDHPSNSCEIYDNRPNICKIDKMYEIKYNKFYTKNKFYELNAMACNRLQEVVGLDKSYIVKIGE